MFGSMNRMCNLCGKLYLTATGNTSNLINYIKIRHSNTPEAKALEEELEKDRKEKETKKKRKVEGTKRESFFVGTHRPGYESLPLVEVERVQVPTPGQPLQSQLQIPGHGCCQ